MDIRELEQIIDRYLSGVATAQEKEFIARWLRKEDAVFDAVDGAKREMIRARLWEAISGATAGEGTVQIGDWAAGEEDKPVQVGDKPQQIGGRPVRRFIAWRRAIQVAAIFCVIVTGGVLYFSRGRRTKADVAYQSITALPGQQRIYLLPDSTRVYLFPHSTLSIPSDYGKTNRSISISGRGFFDVRPDAARPFYVRSGQLVTRVLGTSFEVASRDSSPASVIVRTGRVSVAYCQRPLSALTRDERLRYDLHKGKFAVDTVDAETLCEWWKTGIAFKQTPLQEVIRTMSDWYNVPIRINNRRWLEETVTIRFKGQPLDSAMLLLSSTLGFEYNRERDGIIIY